MHRPTAPPPGGEGPREPGRARGRPRDPTVEGAVLRAARELLVERGFAGASLAAIAARAGVGKGTLYLRWPDKESLVVAAVRDVLVPPPALRTGRVREDLLALLVTHVHHFAERRLDALVAAVISEFPRQPALRTAYLEDVLGPRRTAVREIVTEGIARGEIRGGVDPARVTEAIFGPMLARGLITGVALTEEIAVSLVDLVLDGAAPR